MHHHVAVSVIRDLLLTYTQRLPRPHWFALITSTLVGFQKAPIPSVTRLSTNQCPKTVQDMDLETVQRLDVSRDFDHGNGCGSELLT